MKKFINALILISFVFSFGAAALEIPTGTLVAIVRAEDERRFDKTLEDLMKNRDAKIRARSALAAGRIGGDAAIPALTNLLETDAAPDVRAFAAFALGEIESIKAADAILRVLGDTKAPNAVRARAVEAAGKIAAANATDEKSKLLSKAILDNLEFETTRGKMQSREVVLLGLTAVLRTRPAGGDVATAKFLTDADARIRIDAGNTMTRIRAKNANETLRKMLVSDPDAVARANAARALGAAEDKEALEILLKAAATDADSRVRVAALRSVGSLKESRAAMRLLEYGNQLLASYKQTKKANFTPAEKNEILEIATVLGRLLTNTKDEKAVEFLNEFRQLDGFISPETEIALARITPQSYLESLVDSPDKTFGADWRTSSAAFQGLGEIANLESNAEVDKTKSQTRVLLIQLIGAWLASDQKNKTANNAALAVPDLLRAFAAFKSENTSGIFRPILEDEPDLFIRATVAEVLGNQPPSPENVAALAKAFEYASLNDTVYDDASLAILDALFKLDKKAAFPVLARATDSTDYLVRQKAFEMLRNPEMQKEMPQLAEAMKNDETLQKMRVLPYNPKSNSKLGVILNSDADYRRAVSRKNGTVRAVFTTEKGVFTIDLAPEDAPLTVDNFINLARAGYFNGLAVHRVVPNFVMQDGDPRGDGNGGPGWSIRCEVNMLEYARGAVGMALSGKDTGGSQWFVTHSPQPHLDGGYTVFGRVSEKDMPVVDKIVRGDKILSVRITEGKTTVKRK
jgi:cyclophilin family peptidyl-prolyl cis-trans isomerase/HEAT repeat protein